MKMDLPVRLTWLLLLSATFLPEPGSAALGSPQKDLGIGRQNSLWKKFEEWLKDLFHHRDPTTAPTSSPTTAPWIWTTLKEGETTTSAPEITTTVDKASSPASTNITEESKTPETLTTPQRASEDTEELSISPTPLTGDSGTSAPEIPSTAADLSTDHCVIDTDSTKTLITPAPLSTLGEASATPDPDVNTTPAEDIATEAEVLIGSTTVAKPVTHSPTMLVSLDSGAKVITTSRAETDPAPDSQAKPISLPQYLRMELLKFLTSLCGPRRPGMQSIQLQGCVMLPTCRNYHSRDKRIIKFDFRGPIASRVCLYCDVLACNRYNYSPQHYQGHRTRDEAKESVIIRIMPIQ